MTEKFIADFIVKGLDNLPDLEDAKVIREYFAQFSARPSDKTEGVYCGNGHRLDGMLFGSFRWGIQHGHGSCSDCGWPVVAHHFIFRDKDGVKEELMSLRFYPLPVHESLVEVNAGANIEDKTND